MEIYKDLAIDLNIKFDRNVHHSETILMIYEEKNDKKLFCDLSMWEFRFKNKKLTFIFMFNNHFNLLPQDLHALVSKIIFNISDPNCFNNSQVSK